MTLSIDHTISATVRPNALKRCVSNLINNALRYAKQAQVSMMLRDQVVDILIDDDGPGIPEEQREERCSARSIVWMNRAIRILGV